MLPMLNYFGFILITHGIQKAEKRHMMSRFKGFTKDKSTG